VADWNGQDGNLTTVGTNGGPSYYGTLDQSGNVWEWNEAASGTSRCIRGGSWSSVAPSVDFQTFYLSGSYRTFYGASNRSSDVGFRVASSVNPLSISDFVSVGDVLGSADTTGYGSVNYDYQISKYPITQSQYVEFLNAVAATTDTYGLYNTNMASDSRGGITRSSVAGGFVHAVKASMGNKPVNFVNWFACARYCNWLHNGKPTGSQNASTTESGAYAISGTSATKISGASYWMPTENEWYKAAYFSMTKNGGLGGYWKYATQSDADPVPVSSNIIGEGPFA
jgi:formylglycine-generating enzyme required for sulfatase activity